MLTVRKLKEFLSQFEDDVRIITVSDNFEKQGSKVDARVSEGNYTLKFRQFRDAFDGENYTTQVWEYDKEGEKVIIVTG